MGLVAVEEEQNLEEQIVGQEWLFFDLLRSSAGGGAYSPNCMNLTGYFVRHSL